MFFFIDNFSHLCNILAEKEKSVAGVYFFILIEIS